MVYGISVHRIVFTCNSIHMGKGQGQRSETRRGRGGVMNYELARERLQKQKAVILFKPKWLGILHLIR